MSGSAASRAESEPELVLDAHAWLGEGPVWDVRREVLWWVDILAGAVHAFDPVMTSDRVYLVGSEVGCVAPMADSRLLVAATEELLALDPETGALAPIAGFEASVPRLRCNDGKCDPMGRLWVGRMAFDAAPGAGSLLRLEPDGRFVPALAGLTIPNGLAWPADGRSLLYVDSARREITRYSFDPASGELGPGRPLVTMAELGLPAGALPDGMTIDEEDCLWVAVWGAGCVVRVGLDGRLLDRLDLPVSQPSSCTFGGPDLGDLYITTARERLGPDEEARQPAAGGLFRFRPGVRGRPPDAWQATDPG